nr:hypothetical protein [uncultured Albidiferax sp.]
MTASPSPNNMIMLAAIGIGAYWFMTRKAAAQPVYVRPGAGAAQTNGGAVTGQLISQGGNLLGQLLKNLGSGGGVGSALGANSTYQLPTGGYAQYVPDYAPSNPVLDLFGGGATFDYANAFS